MELFVSSEYLEIAFAIHSLYKNDEQWGTYNDCVDEVISSLRFMWVGDCEQHSLIFVAVVLDNVKLIYHLSLRHCG